MAVGTHKGYVQIWDAAAGKKLSVLEGHTARVGELRGWRDGGRDSCRSKILQLSLIFTQLFSNIFHSWPVNHLSFGLPFLLCCQVRWHGMRTSCRLGAATALYCSATSEPRLSSQSAVSKDTDRKSAGSSGAQTTSC